MALEVCISLDLIEIPSSFILMLLGVTTNRTTEIIQIRFDSFEFL